MLRERGLTSPRALATLNPACSLIPLGLTPPTATPPPGCDTNRQQNH